PGPGLSIAGKEGLEAVPNRADDTALGRRIDAGEADNPAELDRDALRQLIDSAQRDLVRARRIERRRVDGADVKGLQKHEQFVEWSYAKRRISADLVAKATG